MNIETQFEADLTVQSFAYVAKQLAHAPDAVTPAAQYDLILTEAEKHRSALRMVQRDVLEMTEMARRQQKMTPAEFQRLRRIAAQRIARAEQAITLIVAQYAPHAAPASTGTTTRRGKSPADLYPV